jgi:hypothetical protein
MALALYYSVPAAVLALLVYFELRPPDLQPVQRAFLRIALALGICAWLPFLAITAIPHGWWPNPGVWRNVAMASGLLSNVVNVAGIICCLRARGRSTQSLIVALLLALNQMALALFTFATQIP